MIITLLWSCSCLVYFWKTNCSQLPRGRENKITSVWFWVWVQVTWEREFIILTVCLYCVQLQYVVMCYCNCLEVESQPYLIARQYVSVLTCSEESSHLFCFWSFIFLMTAAQYTRHLIYSPSFSSSSSNMQHSVFPLIHVLQFYTYILHM